MVGENIPQHVVIIPDGNRRWAEKQGLIKLAGHAKAGEYENLKKLFVAARDLGVKYVTLWGFSTENWKRSRKEVDALFEVMSKGINSFLKYDSSEKIRFMHLGRKNRIPRDLKAKLSELENSTRKHKDFTVVLAIDYGGRDELLRALEKVREETSHLGELNEEQFSDFLDTRFIPDPDLIIRTGGEKRLSGFMPWQSTYSELYFTETFFPDFDSKELTKAVEEFSERQRRFGK